MEIRLRTLTPLWTGGVDQTCDRLHETGLIGSLRWWYEALVRGLGGQACDPTDHSCTFDEDKYRKSRASSERQRLLDAVVCDACQLFGCTGWSRKFRLRVSDGSRLLDSQQKNFLIPSERKHPTKDSERAGGWFVFSESRVGEFTLDLIPLRDIDLRPISTILALISRHASLGPKGASGYGVVEAKEVTPDLAWTQGFDDRHLPRNNTLPDFRDFFFAKLRFQEPQHTNWWQKIEGIRQAVSGKLDDGSTPRPLRQASQELEQMNNQGILPIAPAIRNWLRYSWKHGLSPAEAHFVFGEAQAVCPNCYQPGFRPDKKNHERKWCPGCKGGFNKGEEIPTTASKIFVSYAYRLDNGQWEFRIWGWLPCKGVFNDRDEFLKSLKNTLQSDDIWKFVFRSTGVRPGLAQWHSRDCKDTDGQAYSQELLGGAP